MATIAKAVLALWLLASPGPALAQDAARGEGLARIELTGAGIEAATLTRESLSALPQVERDVSFMTSKGERRGLYRGPLLWTILERAGLIEGIERNAELGRTLLVTGGDDYAVAFSVGEIAPDFGDTPMMIALDVDGAPLPADEGLRLIVPGDRRGARNVYDIVSIEVR